MSKLWSIEHLYTFLEKLCIVKYNTEKVTLWLCENFIGTYSLQEMFVKSAKSRTYEMYARKIDKEDY